MTTTKLPPSPARRLRNYLLAFLASFLLCGGIVACILAEFAYSILELNKYAFEQVLAASDKPEALKVLFLGNSLLYTYSLPRQLAAIYRAEGGGPLKLQQVVVPGESLSGHLKTGRFAQVLSANGPWDYVVIQPATFETFDSYPSFKRDLAEVIALVRKSSRAQPLIFMTWTDEGEFGRQEFISQTYRRLASELNVRLIADGDLLQFAHREAPQLKLFLVDKHHPNRDGSYLGALLVYYVLSGKMPLDPPLKIETGSVILVNLSAGQRSTLLGLLKKFLEIDASVGQGPRR